MMEHVTLTQEEQARLQTLNNLLAGYMTTEQAATLMGVSTRHTRRILAAYREKGAAALAHGNRGRRPANATPDTLAIKAVRLARTRYVGVNHTHPSELLREREGIDIGRDTLRKILTDAGVNSPRRPRPPKHRVRRQRMPLEGMLLQIDGNYHRWLGDDGPQFTLLLAMDDATGTVVNALFCELENTHSYFLMMRGLIQSHGIPLALYADRHAVFKHTPSPETAAAPTQFSRAMDELGIQLTFACSPQAMGRVERAAGTFQDRLVAELRLAGATTIDDANRVLADFLPRFNRRFKVPAQESEVAYRVVDEEMDLERILCFKYRRRVARDNTVRYRRRTLQILPGTEGRATPARPWMYLKAWTVTWQCSTKVASSLPRRRHHARSSFADSLGEPYIHLSPVCPPTVWARNGLLDWRLQTQPTIPKSPSTPQVATVLEEFAKPPVGDAGSPRRCRRPGGKRCRRRNERACPFAGSPENWVFTERP